MTPRLVQHRLRKIARIGLALLAISAGHVANADTIVFSDNFEDGSVSDWTKSTNFGGITTIVATGTSHTGQFGLEASLDVPPSSGNDLFVRASHDFVAPVTATYKLDLWARSTSCSGCVISYDILVDGISLARTTAPSAFEQRTFSLSGLTSGTHSLTLGMFTTSASSGHFFSSFDDVVISTLAPIPELSTFSLLAAGLALFVIFKRFSIRN